MPRKVFFSFHYQADCTRVAQVRNAGLIEGNPSVSDNDWEKVRRGGNAAIERWIDSQLAGRSATVVLIGSGTAGRKFVNYEIEKSWKDRKGVVGIYIHRLRNLQGEQSRKGRNPFDSFVLPGGRLLSSRVKTYDPPHTSSQDAYKYIADHLASWVEEAVQLR